MKKYFLIFLALTCVIAGCKLHGSGFKQNFAKNTNPLLTSMWFTIQTAHYLYNPTITVGSNVNDSYNITKLTTNRLIIPGQRGMQASEQKGNFNVLFKLAHQ